ncbi:MAG TPA: lysophospholipid acyltransferase family protein [Rhodothermales bacterium]|nr:lysophospholipid acyltransferase family protein [Rhodothermales bacterium]
MLRRIWRLGRLVWSLATHTAYLSVAARWRPPVERVAYRAYRQQVGCALICRILNVRVTLRGAPIPTQPMLYVCNHLGVLDPFILASQTPVAFAAKSEIRSWPFLGWVCREMGLLFVERERPTKTSAFVRQLEDKLAHGVSVVVYPEGTTSRGDIVRPFKTGAFEAVAGDADGAILPFYLQIRAVNGDPARREEATWADDTQAFVEHGWHLCGLKSIEVDLVVGEPIPTAGHDRKELAKRTHKAVVQMHDEALGEQVSTA